jgi:hypothetical protein
MTTTEALCFETCQRVTDVFGFEDPDKKVVRGFYWDDYRPGEQIAVIQSKTGSRSRSRWSTAGGGAETVELYPELEAELARTEGAEREMIVRDERTGKAYGIDYMQKLHKRIPGNAERAMPAPRRTVTRRAPREPARLQARAVEP